MSVSVASSSSLVEAGDRRPASYYAATFVENKCKLVQLTNCVLATVDARLQVAMRLPIVYLQFVL